MFKGRTFSAIKQDYNYAGDANPPLGHPIYYFYFIRSRDFDKELQLVYAPA